MKYVAYHRTSTKDQHLDRGIAELTKYCKTHNIQLYKSKVYTDQRTGKDFDRPRYIMLKEEILESGDVLIVTELDRLGRNKEATLKELRFFKDNGIRVMVLELPTTLIDLSAMENSMARMMLETINNMMIELYASMAQVEIEKREKRQREGIEQKKARGEWDDYGRPRVMDLEEFATHYRLVQQGNLYWKCPDTFFPKTTKTLYFHYLPCRFLDKTGTHPALQIRKNSIYSGKSMSPEKGRNNETY